MSLEVVKNMPLNFEAKQINHFEWQDQHVTTSKKNHFFFISVLCFFFCDNLKRKSIFNCTFFLLLALDKMTISMCFVFTRDHRIDRQQNSFHFFFLSIFSNKIKNNFFSSFVFFSVFERFTFCKSIAISFD